MLVIPDGGSVFDNVGVLEVPHEDHRVRYSGVEIMNGRDRFDGRIQLQINGIRHLDAHFVADQFRFERPGNRFESQRGHVPPE